MNDSKRVKVFFDKRARQFDSYYSEEKPFFWKILDFLFRKSIQTRMKLTLQECKAKKGVNVLDVGCGSARCAVKLAKEGIDKITGIDFSSEMINIAHQVAAEYRVEDKCRFILGDFTDISLNEKFDVCLALGFFDYTREPREYLEKMKAMTTDKIIASFPAKWRLRNIIRIIRLKILKCPLYFYTTGKIASILQDVSIHDYKIKSIGRDYFVVAKLS